MSFLRCFTVLFFYRQRNEFSVNYLFPFSLCDDNTPLSLSFCLRGLLYYVGEGSGGDTKKDRICFGRNGRKCVHAKNFVPVKQLAKIGFALSIL